MLPFSASVRYISTQTHPFEEVGARLASWLSHPVSAALVSDGGAFGRYSYLLAEPDAKAELAFEDQGSVSDLLRAVTAFVEPEPNQETADLPPFTGGLLGLANFELGLRLESMKRRPFRIEGRSAWPELVLLRFPAVLAFDHLKKSLISIGRGDSKVAAEAARKRLTELFYAARQADPPQGPLGSGPLVCETPDGVHEDKVASLVQQIYAGDLFQANLARGWTGHLDKSASPGDLLSALHARGPAPFGACLHFDRRAIVSNSPERFIKLESNLLETRPIKGTRPRGKTNLSDQKLAEELLASTKDRAENLMIVDLMRHDISRVAEVGSVKVEALHALESYASVHHLVSTISGLLRKDLQAADVLCATFPPGSISGAPKVQAMKVICEMEAARGPYCGALFWIDAKGGMDSSVLIRTLALEQDDTSTWLYRVAAGGGIVADSDPASERQETDTKLSLIRLVLEGHETP